MKTSLTSLASLLVLFGCGSGKTTSSNDPPSIALTSPNSQYVQASPISFTATVKASNGNTVKAAYAVNGSSLVTGTAGANGLYTFTGVMVMSGANAIAVYAEDTAGHVGKNGQPPFQVTKAIVLDDVPPTLAADTSVASYFDERVAGLVNDGGVPAMPQQYVFPADATKVTVDDTHPVYKTLTNLSAGPALTSAVLEGSNPSNTPFLRFSAPFAAATESPISVSFTASTSVDGASTVLTDQGTLLASAQTHPQTALFDFPVSSETLTALTSVTASPAHVTLTLTAVDAAGNRSQPLVTNFDVHLLGGPVTAREDVSYASAGDLLSMHPYSLAGKTYQSLWSGTNGGEITRALRYVVYNPASAPVAISLAGLGDADVREEWDDLSYPITPGGYFCNALECGLDKQAYNADTTNPASCPNVIPFNHNTQYPALETQAAAFSYPSLPSPNGATVLGPVKSYSHYGVSQSAHDASSGEPAAAMLDGHYVLPAAANGTPGELVLYLGRPWENYHFPTLTVAAPSGTAAPTGYYADAHAWWNVSVNQTYPCSGSGTFKYLEYQGVVGASKLTQAFEHYTGTHTVTPYAITGDQQHALGEAGPLLSQSYDETFNH